MNLHQIKPVPQAWVANQKISAEWMNDECSITGLPLLSFCYSSLKLEVFLSCKYHLILYCLKFHQGNYKNQFTLLYAVTFPDTAHATLVFPMLTQSTPLPFPKRATLLPFCTPFSFLNGPTLCVWSQSLPRFFEHWAWCYFHFYPF